MKKLEAIIRPGRLDRVKKELAEAGAPSLTVSSVSGRGSEALKKENWRGEDYVVDLHQKVKVELIVRDVLVEDVIKAIQTGARSGNPGDGKIFIIPVEDAFQIRTGDRGKEAL